MDDSCLDKKTKSAVQNIVLKKTLGKLHRKLSFQMSSSKILKIVYWKLLLVQSSDAEIPRNEKKTDFPLSNCLKYYKICKNTKKQTELCKSK